MKFSIARDNYEISDALLSAIVRAIDKAVSEDVPNQLRSMPLETNNCLYPGRFYQPESSHFFY